GSMQARLSRVPLRSRPSGSRLLSAHLSGSLLSDGTEVVAEGVADEGGDGGDLAVRQVSTDGRHVAAAADDAPDAPVDVLQARVVGEDGGVLDERLVAVGAVAGGADAGEHRGALLHEGGHVVAAGSAGVASVSASGVLAALALGVLGRRHAHGRAV